jgi:hypothetical protein
MKKLQLIFQKLIANYYRSPLENDFIPLPIRIKALGYPLINYQKNYGDQDPTVNYAKGEITKPNMSRYPDRLWIGRRFLGQGQDERGEYDTISIYLGGGYFKLISKVY